MPTINVGTVPTNLAKTIIVNMRLPQISEAQSDRRGCPVWLLFPGCVNHGQDARAERFRQRRPGVEDELQVGVNLRFTGQGMGQGERGIFRNALVGLSLRRRGCGFNSRRLHISR